MSYAPMRRISDLERSGPALGLDTAPSAYLTEYTPGADDLALSPDESDRLEALIRRTAVVASGAGTCCWGNSVLKSASLDYSDPEVRWATERLSVIAEAANELWFGLETARAELSLLRYGVGGYYRRHSDVTPGATFRKVSLSAQLSESDAYDGGDLYVDMWREVNPHVAPRERGSVVVFPANTSHWVTPVRRGVRLAAVCWLTGERLR